MPFVAERALVPAGFNVQPPAVLHTWGRLPGALLHLGPDSSRRHGKNQRQQADRVNSTCLPSWKGPVKQGNSRFRRPRDLADEKVKKVFPAKRFLTQLGSHSKPVSSLCWEAFKPLLLQKAKGGYKLRVTARTHTLWPEKAEFLIHTNRKEPHHSTQIKASLL